MRGRCSGKIFRNVAALRRVRDGDETVGMRVGERTKEHAVHRAEHGGVASDPNREREHCGHREAGRLSQKAKRKANIVRQECERTGRLLVSHLLLMAEYAAEGEQRLPTRTLG